MNKNEREILKARKVHEKTFAKMNEHKEAEDLANRMHKFDAPRLRKHFKEWFMEEIKKCGTVVCPEMEIADFCVQIYNNRQGKDKAIIEFKEVE